MFELLAATLYNDQPQKVKSIVVACYNPQFCWEIQSPGNHVNVTLTRTTPSKQCCRTSSLPMLTGPLNSPRFQSEGCAKQPTRSKGCFSYILMMAGPVQSWFLFCFWHKANLNNSRFSNDFWLVYSARWSNLYQCIITMECLCRSKKQIYHLMKIL